MIKSLPIAVTSVKNRRHPKWIKAKLPTGENYRDLKKLMRELDLHTVCEEARCPNIGECWNDRTATFMILGDVCTRRCMYCAVAKGTPIDLDLDESRRLGEAVKYLKLDHVVITSVNRDDLRDGGASIFSECIRESRKNSPNCTIEVLIPDLEGNWEALAEIIDARPNVLNHNIETVPRIYRRTRPRADYDRSLDLLRRSKILDRDILTKTGLMVGLGESFSEILQTISDIRETDCDILTIGQYLSPSPKHFDIDRYYTPNEFGILKIESLKMGFRYVESGPMVRSSYHARQQAQI